MQTKSGTTLHPIGIGTWKLGGYPAFSPGHSAEINALRHAVSLGQNHIDTAEMYLNGQAEKAVGQAIAPLKRHDLFVASKLWKNHIAKDSVRPAVTNMLQRLGTDYLDMLYIHAPWFDAPWREAIPQIDRLIDEGVVRYLGVSNFAQTHLQEALALARHPIAANQLHYSCLHQQEASPALRQFCAANGVTVVAYMPLERNSVASHPVVTDIAAARGATTAQIALAWLIANHTLPIPKATNRAHITQNYAAAAITLSPEEKSRLDNIIPPAFT